MFSSLSVEDSLDEGTLTIKTSLRKLPVGIDRSLAGCSVELIETFGLVLFYKNVTDAGEEETNAVQQ